MGRGLDDFINNLAPESRRWLVTTLRLFVCWDTSPEIHLMRLPDPSTLDELVTEVKSGEDRDTEVAGKEWRSGELTGEEGVETSNEDEENDPENTPVRKPRLEPIVIRQLFTIDTLCSATVIKAKERNVHRQPCEETTSSGKSLEPVEYLISGIWYGQEGEEGE